MNSVRSLNFGPKKYDVIIGIDPDVTKSGVAWLNPTTRILEINNKSFPELIKVLDRARELSLSENKTVIVVIEASWINTHNRHIIPGQTNAAASKSGYNIGRNHQTGIALSQYAQYIGLDVVEQPPLRKGWSGGDRKITHKELAYFTGIAGRTNQEERDAALLAWNYANLPIKVKKHA